MTDGTCRRFRRERDHLCFRFNLPLYLGLLLSLFLLYQPLQGAVRIHLIGTGGTIAGGDDKMLTATDLLALAPDLGNIADVTTEDFARIGSSQMTPELQFKLAHRINEIFSSSQPPFGIVVTHGTDSLEETAFFLDLMVRSNHPVVFAAAMRPPRLQDSDGPRNLLNAIRIAASPEAIGMGVLITLNDEIHAASEARKEHASAVNAFRSPRSGPVGYVDDNGVYFLKRPIDHLKLAVKAIEPRVDLLTVVAGPSGHLLRAAVAAGARGVVIEAFGRGNVPPSLIPDIQRARNAGVTVVFTTRTHGGRVEIQDWARKMGVVGGGDLDGLKARILLITVLGTTHDPSAVQAYFDRISGFPALSN